MSISLCHGSVSAIFFSAVSMWPWTAHITLLCLLHLLTVHILAQWLLSLLLHIYIVLCRLLLLHHLAAIFHWCVSRFCSALLHLFLHPASSLGCLYLRAFCVFSCACPSPSRSEHWGAHSDPPGGEATKDQPQTPAGGGQRYGSELDRML